MTDKDFQTDGRRRARAPQPLLRRILLAFCALALVGCGARGAGGDSAAALQEIAAQYAQDSDLAQAQASLSALSVANATQLLASLAEEAVSQGKPEQMELARLATDLGVKSPRLVALVQPTAAPTAAPTATLPPTATPVPAATATEAAPPTDALPTATATGAAPTASPTPLESPRVVADGDVNLRGGPGRQYAIVDRLRSGEEVAIVGRNASGDWWQLEWDSQAWVAGTVVKILGPIDTVAVAKNIPTPPPVPTKAPVTPAPAAPPAPPQPTAAPKPSTAYVVKSVRTRPLGQDAQQCGGGEHNIFVQVVDPAGNPIDGVRIREVFTGLIHVSGEKGPGRVDYDIYMDGGGQVQIVDDGNNPLSPLSRGMSANLPDWDLFLNAGYCNCKPYPDEASCRAGWEARDFRYMPNSHYVYEVVFQRTY